MRHCLSLLLFLSIIPSLLYAQKNDCYIINEDFSNKNLIEIIEEIKSKYDYPVFYKSEWIDTIYFSGSVKNECLTSFLAGAISNPLFSVNSFEGKVILSHNQPILPISKYFLKVDPSKEVDEDSVVNLFVLDRSVQLNPEIIQIGNKSEITSNPVLVTGKLVEKESRDPLIGALVYLDKKNISTLTGLDGTFALRVLPGRYHLNAQFIGMESKRVDLIVFSTGSFELGLEESITALSEVVVTTDRNSQFENTEMGVERLDIQSIKTIPKIMGENDIVRATLTLPGVTNTGEASQGFNVRGGNADQNLILYNNLPVYNSSHFFGFFSIFNEDFVGSSELFKSYMPPKYGGRLSSVLAINSGDVDTEELEGTGGISPITGRLSVSSPIIKDKLAIKVGSRLTYSKWILNQVNNQQVKNSDASFYDIAIRAKYKLNKSNSFYINAYRSKDSFNLLSDSSFQYTNTLIGLEWFYKLNNSLEGYVSTGFSEYDYTIENDRIASAAFRINYSIKEYNIHSNMDYEITKDLILSFGLNSKYYEVAPGAIIGTDTASLVENRRIQTERGLESAAYISSEVQLNDKFSLNGGLRYSVFNAIGPKESYVFRDISRGINTIEDTLSFRGIYQTHHGPELRLSARMEMTSDLSLKLSYVRNRQYMNILSNSTSISPIDIWKLSDEYIKPQIGDQYSLGMYKLSRGRFFESSIEFFYKRQSNLLDYKIGSEFLLNESIASDVLQGEGTSYGVEISLKKPNGRLNGWISYTYSRSFLEIDGPTINTRLNNGERFPANFDRPHNLNIVSNYKINNRFSASMNISYLTGRPVTVPLSRVQVGDNSLIYYSERNEFRIPNYFRVDVGINLEGSHKKEKPAHGFWTLSVYNLLGRNNAYSIFFEENLLNSGIQGYQLSIFDQVIPTLTYNFKF